MQVTLFASVSLLLWVHAEREIEGPLRSASCKLAARKR